MNRPRTRKPTSRALVIACAFALSCVSVPVRAAVRQQAVALSGSIAPFLPADISGATFTSFDTPVIGSQGGTAFWAGIAGNGVSSVNDEAFWISGGNEFLAPIVRESEAADDAGSGVVFGALDRNSINIASDGSQGFRAELAGSGITTANDDSYWTKTRNAQGTQVVLSLIGQEGEPLNGTTGPVFDRFIGKFALLGNEGAMALRGTIAGTGINTANDEGVFHTDNNGIAELVREGQPASGTIGGVYTTVGRLTNNSAVVLNGLGGMAYTASFLPFPSQAVWTGSAGNVVFRSRDGDNIPPLGKSFSTFSDPVINNLGTVAYIGFYDNNNGAAVLTETSAGLIDLVADEGGLAIGLGPDVRFDTVAGTFSNPVINASNDVAFLARIVGTGVGGNDRAIFGKFGNALTALVQLGDNAPGFGNSTFATFDEPSINAAGQVAIPAILDTGETGVWVWTAGTLELAVATGMQVQLAPGDVRTIDAVHFAGEENLVAVAGLEQPGPTGNQDGRPSGFSDLGQVAYHANFTDGSSGILIGRIVPLGDYNGSGVVDSADYTLWRDTLGMNVLAGSGADGDEDGMITQADYDFWKTRFGSMLGAGSGNVIAIPEPASCAMLIVMLVINSLKRPVAKVVPGAM